MAADLSWKIIHPDQVEIELSNPLVGAFGLTLSIEDLRTMQAELYTEALGSFTQWKGHFAGNFEEMRKARNISALQLTRPVNNLDDALIEVGRREPEPAASVTEWINYHLDCALIFSIAAAKDWRSRQRSKMRIKMAEDAAAALAGIHGMQRLGES